LTEITLLTDYKGIFGSKYTATPYRSGFDQTKLAAAFAACDVRAVYVPIGNIDFRTMNFAGRHVLYTSSEDEGGHYKSFIEDIVLALEHQGARPLPRFELLRAHHNKVFMEMLRDLLSCPEARTVSSRYLGTLEDLDRVADDIVLPAVVKPSAGSMSAGVELVRTRDELLHSARRVSRSHSTRPRVRDFARRIRRRGYVAESWHRRKFVVQQLVPDLDHDYKVLVYGSKLYALHRNVRPGDFRASGSGRFSWPTEVPAVVLDVSAKLAKALDVPWLSVDVALAHGVAHVIEFQVIYFGSLTLESSPGYFESGPTGWTWRPGRSELENEYAAAVVDYIRRAPAR
jgi:hypothetical protein